MQGNADGAKTLVRQSRQFAEEREMRFIYPAVAFAEAQVSAAAGEPERALDSFARGERLALDMGMRPMVLNTRAGAAQVMAGLGRNGEAAAKLDGAREMAREIGALFQADEMRSMYLDGAMKKLS